MVASGEKNPAEHLITGARRHRRERHQTTEKPFRQNRVSMDGTALTETRGSKTNGTGQGQATTLVLPYHVNRGRTKY